MAHFFKALAPYGSFAYGLGPIRSQLYVSCRHFCNHPAFRYSPSIPDFPGISVSSRYSAFFRTFRSPPEYRSPPGVQVSSGHPSLLRSSQFLPGISFSSGNFCILHAIQFLPGISVSSGYFAFLFLFFGYLRFFRTFRFSPPDLIDLIYVEKI